MKLGEVLAGRAGGVFEAPTRAVKFKVVGKDAQGSQVVADATAELAFVMEDARLEARIEAEQSLRQQFPSSTIPSDLLNDEKVYFLLLRALRDPEDKRQPFASSVDQLKQALHRRAFVQIFSDYEQFCADEFPERIDDQQFEELIEEAKKKSLGDLLSSHDSYTILRALPSLVDHFGKSQAAISGAGEPG